MWDTVASDTLGRALGFTERLHKTRHGMCCVPCAAGQSNKEAHRYSTTQSRALPRPTRLLQSEVSRPVLRHVFQVLIKLYDPTKNKNKNIKKKKGREAPPHTEMNTRNKRRLSEALSRRYPAKALSWSYVCPVGPRLSTCACRR